MVYQDRRNAGQELAKRLAEFRDQNAIVLALPRGGVVVGREVADRLGLPLDVIVVAKIGAPANPEYAIGALAETGDVLVDEHVVAICSIPRRYVEAEIARQKTEIARRCQLYRRGARRPDLRGRVVILVDDGIATGFTMQVAIQAVRAQQPAQVVVAVPVASTQAVERIQRQVDRFVCLVSPEPFIAVGRWYQRFTQVSDEVVRAYLDGVPEDLPTVGGAPGSSWPFQSH